MQSSTWQYKTAIIKVPAFGMPEKKAKSVEEQLNHFGSQGWELVHAPDAISYTFTAIFKKRR